MSFDTSLPFGKGDGTPIISKHARAAGLVLEWGRMEERTAVLRARASFTGVLELIGYFPWDWRGAWRWDGNLLTGSSLDEQDGFVVWHCLAPSHSSTETATESVERSHASLRLPVVPGDTLYLCGSLDESTGAAKRLVQPHCDTGQVDEVLKAAAQAYEARRVATSGQWDGLAASITNNIHWTVLLQPEKGLLYAPAGRRWIFPRHATERDHWTLFAWDSFFNALELAVEDPELARAAVDAVLATQYENGNIPNWRGRFGGTPDRSQPPVGAFTVLKLFLRTRDRSLLESTFPYLARWSEWWSAVKAGGAGGAGRRRDGNGNGLFEWGSDGALLSTNPPPWEVGADGRQRAAWESGQDDLPNWDDAVWDDDAETLTVESVDINALLALDYECLAAIAGELGDRASQARYLGRHQSLVRRVNEDLWDDERGMYVDRNWDGEFSPRVAASSFLPLIAGIPDQSRAQRMLETMLDETRFWGPYVIPTISRDDPAFDEQQYWRGSIWPPINYLIYHGLRRYGFHAAATQLASRSVDLFIGTWREHQLCRENYDSRTGQGAGHRHQSWGPLFALIGIEEFIDATPWDGVRVGSLHPSGSSTLERIPVMGHDWTITLTPDGLHVALDNGIQMSATAPLVMRQIQLLADGLAAEVVVHDATKITVRQNGALLHAEIDGAQQDMTEQGVELAPGQWKVRFFE
jgi:neutral trehalase